MNKSKLRGGLHPIWFIAVLVVAGTGCAGSSKVQTPETSAVAPNDGLNATVWALRAAEYDANALTLYNAAERALTDALADSTWSAHLGQAETEGYTQLPPAVVLDVDETALDNGVYQVELVTQGASFSPESWLEWVLSERAVPIPGALRFARQAADLGVTVIYLTNRRANMEEATRKNLIRFGFPVDTTIDAVLTRGERPEWSQGDKTGRRDFVAANFRILAIVGDDLNDFLNVAGLNLSERDSAVARAHSYWGSKWFMLPNPQYGSWERAAFGGDYSLSESERRERKLDRLRNLLER